MTAELLNINPMLAGPISCGHIDAVEDDKYRIKLANTHVIAVVATSCLVEPLQDDLVACICYDDEYFIYQILKRSDKSLNLQVPGDLTITADQGALYLRGMNTSVTAMKQLELNSSELQLHSLNSQQTSDQITISAQNMQVRAQQLNWISKRFQLLVDHFTQHAKHVVRKVDGTETLSANNLIQSVRSLFTQHSTHATITAKKDMRIDGERIHMG